MASAWCVMAQSCKLAANSRCLINWHVHSQTSVEWKQSTFFIARFMVGLVCCIMLIPSGLLCPSMCKKLSCQPRSKKTFSVKCLTHVERFTLGKPSTALKLTSRNIIILMDACENWRRPNKRHSHDNIFFVLYSITCTCRCTSINLTAYIATQNFIGYRTGLGDHEDSW